MNQRPPAEPGEKSTGAGHPGRRAWRRWWKWGVRLSAVVALFGVLIVGCDGLFYYPSRKVYYTPRQLGLQHEDVVFAARDGVKLTGWFMPAVGDPKGTIVHFHGNAENMTSHTGYVAWVPAAGYHLFVFDYRGYGQSAGRVTRKGTILDGHAALDYVLSRSDVDPHRVFFFGQSIGGAIAIVVAVARPEVQAIAVDSTFSSYRRIASRHLRALVKLDWLARLGARLLISKGYDPIDVVHEIAPRPLLVITSGQDQTCFPELSRELFEAAAEPKELWHVPEAGHTEALVARSAEAERRIAEWFERSLDAER